MRQVVDNIARRLATAARVAPSSTGCPGIAMSTSAMSSWSRGATVSQRKLPISGIVTSSRTSKPTLSRQNASASSWSWTQSWVVLMRIMVASSGWSSIRRT